MTNEISPSEKTFITNLAIYYPYSLLDLIKAYVSVPKPKRSTRLLRVAAGLTAIESMTLSKTYCELVNTELTSMEERKTIKCICGGMVEFVFSPGNYGSESICPKCKGAVAYNLIDGIVILAPRHNED